MVEMIGCAGYDFVILDTEHTLVDPQRLENLIRAAETAGLTPFVRVPEADPGAVLRALDAGAMGIVPFCAMSTTPDRRAQWRADGVTAFVVGEDRDLTARALRGHLARTAGRE